MKRKMSIIAGLSVCGLLFAGCSSAGVTDPGPSASHQAAGGGGGSSEDLGASIVAAVKVDPAVQKLLPAEYAKSGVLQEGTNIQFPPANFFASDGKTPIGNEIDTAKAIAARLGVKVEFQNSPFENLITSLQSGRVDFTMASMNDTPERQKKIDFVDYFKTGIGMLVKKGNPDNIKTPQDLCGHSVTAGVASSQATWAKQLSQKCVADGHKAIDVVESNDDQQRLNSVRTGRDTAELNDLANLLYIARTAGNGAYFEVANSEPLEGALYGIGVTKGNTALRDAIQAALQSLMDDGTYQKILDAWGLTSAYIGKATVNAGTD